MKVRREETIRLTLPENAALAGGISYEVTAAPAAVLFVHGFGSTRTGLKARAVEAECTRRGWTFAAFDFRGHGQSTGDLIGLRGSALLADLDAIHVHLVERGIRQLYVVASSMGAWATAWFAVRRPEAMAAAVFLAPAFQFLHGNWARLDEAAREQWRGTGLLRVHNEWLDVEVGYGLAEERDQFPPAELAAKWALPLLIYQGLRDPTTPHTDSLEFVEQTAFPDVELRLLKAGDHRLMAYREVMATAACDFFARRGFPT